MKIAFLSPFFWPEPISTGKYNTILVEAMLSSQIDIDVYCSHPIYPDWIPKKHTDELPGVQVIRGGAGMRYSSSQVVKRLSLELWYLSFIFFNTLKNRKKYDAVVSVYPPVFFGFVSGIFKKKTDKHIVISHDIQGILANQEGSLFRKSVANIMKNIEQFVYRKADHIVFLSESMKKFCVDNYGIKPENTSVFYPFEDISEKMLTNDIDIFNNNEKRIVYSGALGEKQAPEKIIELFETITQSDPDFKCFIFSSGPKFQELIKKNSNTRIEFHNLVPLLNLKELLEKSLIQLIPQELGTADAVLPSKLPNIITAGCAVLAITDKGNELELLLQKVDNAFIFHDWSYQKIADEVIDFSNKSNRNVQPNNVNGKFEMFDVNRLVTEIKSLVGNKV